MSENSPEELDSATEVSVPEDESDVGQSQESRIYDEAGDDDDPDVPGAFRPMSFHVSERRVGDLLSDKVKQDLDPRPSFQRGYVWDKGKASRLIESVLLNVPLPLVYTAEEEDGREVVIDGQQRLLTLFGFIEGRFPRDESAFRLSGLKIMKDLNRKSFNQLDKKIQRKIQRYGIQVIRINQDSDPNVKFEIFERLNSGSVSLNAQELRNCIYRGSFNELLRELARYENFRRAIANENAMDRMRDAELILRFLAFWERTYLKYPGGMRSFLNDFMYQHKDLSERKSREWAEVYKKASDLCYTVFGPDAFRRFSIGSDGNRDGGWETTVNRALFDVVMWGFANYKKEEIVPKADAIRSGLVDLILKDGEFRDAIIVATNDKVRVTTRFETWKRTLDNIVEGSQPNPRLFSMEIKKEFFRDSSTCGICNQQIKSLDDCEVDHIKPFSEGGLTQRDNAQLAHRYCNRAKGNRTSGI